MFIQAVNFMRLSRSVGTIKNLHTKFLTSHENKFWKYLNGRNPIFYDSTNFLENKFSMMHSFNNTEKELLFFFFFSIA